jgi:hypothetical protein
MPFVVWGIDAVALVSLIEAMETPETAIIAPSILFVPGGFVLKRS